MRRKRSSARHDRSAGGDPLRRLPGPNNSEASAPSARRLISPEARIALAPDDQTHRQQASCVSPKIAILCWKPRAAVPRASDGPLCSPARQTGQNVECSISKRDEAGIPDNSGCASVPVYLLDRLDQLSAPHDMQPARTRWPTCEASLLRASMSRTAGAWSPILSPSCSAGAASRPSTTWYSSAAGI